MNAPLEIAGLGDILDRFDAFLIDQFGVLRDGRAPYPQAAPTLSALKTAGKRNIILSNSGKRSHENSVRLAALGFDPASWDWFLTSGETAWLIMAEEAEHARRKCLLISRDGDTSPIDGLDIERTDDAHEADIVMIAASEGDIYPISYYETLLAPAARVGRPCLCTNPDKVMLTRNGTTFGAGRIAELYEKLGGTVRWIGKPFPDIYAQARKFLEGIDPARICCIGDSIENDILGARNAGFASLLVTTGILDHTSAADREALYEKHGATPDFVAPMFRM